MTIITEDDLKLLEREYKQAERAAVDAPDDPSLRLEADRCRKVYENRRETAKRQRRLRRDLQVPPA